MKAMSSRGKESPAAAKSKSPEKPKSPGKEKAKRTSKEKETEDPDVKGAKGAKKNNENGEIKWEKASGGGTKRKGEAKTPAGKSVPAKKSKSKK